MIFLCISLLELHLTNFSLILVFFLENKSQQKSQKKLELKFQSST